ncbi:thioredoxin family protein [Thermodesulforhabdus norvegica]|uniref:Thioredoxin 1 n=1 Tax=Thermodesulforhabdus norvegica TaxID=39841 RepID=A0A1I4VFA8_9BACT|nr:thioredoxin family protein [Thermodesulforhabdus norvegica]SFM99859.1 thioredoxin 1 [Thermodesulforhabdus norvegica]
MKRTAMWVLAVLVLAGVIGPWARAQDDSRTEIPVPGMVTLVDLGAHKCIPCKMMAPILDELRKEYDGRAAVLFIDVWENREAARRFGIRAIPTQIFYDKEGREVFRHVGFMDKESIVRVFRKLGVE